MRKAVFKYFAIFAGKRLCWSLFLTKLQALKAATLLKRYSNTGVFLWILRNFKEHLFGKTFTNGWINYKIFRTNFVRAIKLKLAKNKNKLNEEHFEAGKFKNKRLIKNDLRSSEKSTYKITTWTSPKSSFLIWYFKLLTGIELKHKISSMSPIKENY